MGMSSLHKRMASRFFPRSLKLSSDSAPSLPWSLAASTHLLQGCPSIISGLGKDLRSATVAIAVEPSPRWICCCFSCCLAARRCSPLTSSSALSDILSAQQIRKKELIFNSISRSSSVWVVTGCHTHWRGSQASRCCGCRRNTRQV